ncbi:hypothetical protein HT576_09000 [Haloterrigena sp. SYSU A121-1]|uniref:Uncharacterized protein n=1 Tax=Haloterrigena gelatinilytica TaxID=2741724 RepID=A0A8J8GNN5_9EURY|nr:hypothetical protein [Haloterrigena gelatinilytica]NUB91157.1 hypothetical protein [Haloterrigena gelatinilytica]
MRQPQYDEFDDDVEWLFVAFSTVVAEALKNNVDKSLIARVANSISAAAAKQNLEEQIEEMQEGENAD